MYASWARVRYALGGQFKRPAVAYSFASRVSARDLITCLSNWSNCRPFTLSCKSKSEVYSRFAPSFRSVAVAKQLPSIASAVCHSAPAGRLAHGQTASLLQYLARPTDPSTASS